MHTRRFASFILGAWILGCLLMGFVTSQNLQNVDRVLNNPPGPVAKDVEDLGSDITRILLRYQASELNRFLLQTWGVLQLGLGAAFLSACIFTAHRSKFMMIVSTSMMLIVATQIWYLEPAMRALGRSFDFMPVTAMLREREAAQGYSVWFSVMEILKLLLGVGLSVRLLFDRYAWQQKLAGTPQRVSRRRRRTHHEYGEEPESDRPVKSGTVAAATSGGVVAGTPAIEADVVDEAHDRHVDG